MSEERLVATGSFDGSAIIWCSLTGLVKQRLPRAHDKGVSGVAFSPDGSLLATAGGDGRVVLWDMATAAPRHIFQGCSDWVLCVVFSPDGRCLASGGG
ncbi:WD40-repeat-containing domain protein [Baffinella frigidus]|nr:WD40-repeat-containing domain protein [Cryptophyta sp. CCMP2293]